MSFSRPDHDEDERSQLVLGVHVADDRELLDVLRATKIGDRLVVSYRQGPFIEVHRSATAIRAIVRAGRPDRPWSPTSGPLRSQLLSDGWSRVTGSGDLTHEWAYEDLPALFDDLLSVFARAHPHARPRRLLVRLLADEPWTDGLAWGAIGLVLVVGLPGAIGWLIGGAVAVVAGVESAWSDVAPAAGVGAALAFGVILFGGGYLADRLHREWRVGNAAAVGAFATALAITIAMSGAA